MGLSPSKERAGSPAESPLLAAHPSRCSCQTFNQLSCFSPAVLADPETKFRFCRSERCQPWRPKSDCLKCECQARAAARIRLAAFVILLPSGGSGEQQSLADERRDTATMLALLTAPLLTPWHRPASSAERRTKPVALPSGPTLHHTHHLRLRQFPQSHRLRHHLLPRRQPRLHPLLCRHRCLLRRIGPWCCSRLTAPLHRVRRPHHRLRHRGRQESHRKSTMLPTPSCLRLSRWAQAWS